MKKFIKKMAFAFLIGVLACTVVPATVQAAGWKQNKNGYWWQENDYSYPKNQWKTIYGKQYHFNSSGYMDTGWKKIDGKWYYLGSKNDGAKKTYWQKVYGKYYWLGSDGAMRTGWQQVYGKYYWLGHSNDGAMKTGWQTVYGKKYYLGGANDGAMKTGWQKIGRYDYYFGRTGESNEGVLRTSTWVGNYYVDEYGRWDKYKTIEISEYLINGKDDEMIKKLGLKFTGKASDSEIRYYEKDKVVYCVGTDYSGNSGFEFTNRGATYITLYGITPGQSESEALNTWKSLGWKMFNEDDDYYLLKEINGEVYEINFFVNSAGKLTGWRLRDWIIKSMPSELNTNTEEEQLEKNNLNVDGNVEEKTNGLLSSEGTNGIKEEESAIEENNIEMQGEGKESDENLEDKAQENTETDIISNIEE